MWATVRDWYLPDVVDDELDGRAATAPGVLGRGRATPYDGSRRALAALKNLTSDLIGLFCTQVRERHGRSKYGERPLVRYAADLVVPRETEIAVAVLKGGRRALRHARRRPGRRARSASASCSPSWSRCCALRGPGELSRSSAPTSTPPADDAGRLRVVVDQVAVLTDASALAWHDRLRCRRPPAARRRRTVAGSHVDSAPWQG